jgi:TPR repeat protein
LADRRSFKRKFMKIPVSQWCGQRRRLCRYCHCQEEGGQEMKKFVLMFCLWPMLAMAEIEHARDLMEENRFEEAMRELWPAARSGNADAEELIGVMYAMGLGVERDDVRAFEWYLRSAMKGHPGAQSGVGWYYEIGRGLPAPDLVRAYTWYVLSAIGGDPDAAISQEEVVKKMTAEQIEKAHELIDDYRVWLFPFR